MANPQREHGNVQIANDLFEALCTVDMSGAEFRITLAILRKTYGWRKKEAHVTLADLIRMTGIRDRGYLSRVTSALADRHIIVKHSARAEVTRER